jgi:hypothetical protein
LSRAVRATAPKVRLNTKLGSHTILSRRRPHGAAQIRRGLLAEQAMPWARRNPPLRFGAARSVSSHAFDVGRDVGPAKSGFRPTKLRHNHPRWAVPRSILAL